MSVAIDALRFWVVREVTFFTFKLDFVEVHGRRLHLKTDDTILIPKNKFPMNFSQLSTKIKIFSLAMRVIIENKFQMVVDVKVILADHAETIAVLELQLHCIRIDNSCRYRKIVH